MAKKDKKPAEETEEGAAAGAEAPVVEYVLDEEGKPVLDDEGNPIVVSKKKPKKKLIIIIAAVLLLVGGGAGAYFAGLIPIGGVDEELSAEQAKYISKIINHDLDSFLVNLNNPGKQVSMLKMTVTLELPNQASEDAVNAQTPRIRDAFQVYLRELHSTDLQGSAGIHRLREELILRINKIIEPEKVNDVLFKEIIVQ